MTSPQINIIKAVENNIDSSISIAEAEILKKEKEITELEKDILTLKGLQRQIGKRSDGVYLNKENPTNGEAGL